MARDINEARATIASERFVTACERLAEIILASAEYDEYGPVRDHLADLEAIRPILPLEAWENVCLAMDVCPRHVIDLNICVDDYEAFGPENAKCPWAEKVIEEREAAEDERRVKQAREQLVEDYLAWQQKQREGQ